MPDLTDVRGITGECRSWYFTMKNCKVKLPEHRTAHDRKAFHDDFEDCQRL